MYSNHTYSHNVSSYRVVSLFPQGCGRSRQEPGPSRKLGWAAGGFRSKGRMDVEARLRVRLGQFVSR